MKTFGAAVRKEVLEQWRTSRLLIAGAVLVLFGLTSPLLARFTPELIKLVPEGEAIASIIPAPVIGDAVAQYLKNMMQFGIVLALLISMGMIVQEKERGTAAVMLVKPLPRWAFVLAKFLALVVTFGVSLAVAGVAAYYYTALLFAPLDAGRWLVLNGLLLVMLLVYAALALLASAVARTQAVAGGLAFGGMIGLILLGAIPPVHRWLPDQLMTWAGAQALGPADPAWPALAGSLILITLALAGSWLALERQEV